MTWDQVGESISFGEVIELVAELEREMGSHLFAAQAGWSFTATYGELMEALHYDAFLKAHFEPSKEGVLFPWTHQTGQEAVTDEERRQGAEYLARHTAIRD